MPHEVAVAARNTAKCGAEMMLSFRTWCSHPCSGSTSIMNVRVTEYMHRCIHGVENGVMFMTPRPNKCYFVTAITP
jgi:hypothetical protein